jgi:hypothetical protein
LLIDGHRGEAVGQVRPVGESDVGIELEQRGEHESPSRDLAVREGQAIGLQHEIT